MTSASRPPDQVFVCNKCKAIYREAFTTCDCIETKSEENPGFQVFCLMPLQATPEIINASKRVAINAGFDGMDEPVYTFCSDHEARRIYDGFIAVGALRT
jgi:hypothetical protein